jgi:hypothetical protein
MSTSLTLADCRADSLRRLLPDQHDLPGWHAALVAEIANHLSPAHAAVLAVPSQAEGRLRWTVSGNRARGFADLPVQDRQALTRALGSILSDIRRLAESGAAPTVAAAWPMLSEVPELGQFWAVDGRPVLSAWGFAPGAASQPAGLLARYDDGIRWTAEPRPPWGTWAAAAGTLAALALVAGLLLPPLGARLFPPLAQCRADPAGLALLMDANAVSSRQLQLETELALLQQEAGRRRMLCALPGASDPAAAPTPPAAAPPPPRAELPQQRWEQGDLAMLEGCWRRISNMTTREIATGRVLDVAEWSMCFDRVGTGRQTLVLTSGERCEGPLRASFAQNRMLINEPAECTGPTRTLTLGRYSCERQSDTVADCERTELSGPTPGRSTPGRFTR